MELEYIDFFGFKISIFNKEQLIKSIKTVTQEDFSKVYYGYSLAALVYLKKHPSYYKTTESFDVMVTDGRLFFLMAKFFGYNLKYDISISQLTIMSIELANKMNLKLMMIGGTKESNNKAFENIRLQYPEIQLCHGRDGYFNVDEEKNIFEMVRQNAPNILLLGFPTPAKQIFASKIKEQIKGCVIIPCGGMIDVLAGKEKLTPDWLKKIGLASIYRHIQHPKRLPELINIYLLSIKVFSICFYLKYIKKAREINIPSIVLKKTRSNN